MPKQSMKWRSIIIPVFGALLFFGAMVWAKSDDPFSRKWFSVKTPHGKVDCVVVLPKPARACPVVLYSHGSGGSLMTDGKELRQMAELGMAVVSMEYNQTNGAVFEEEFAAVLDHARQQPWALSHSVAWIGYSLGAQNQLKFLLKHPDAQPNLFVRLDGGWIPELDSKSALQDSRLKMPVLIVHGERDEVFPVGDAHKLAALLTTNQVPVDLRVLPETRHGLDPNRALIFREIAEYIKARLTPLSPQPEFTSPKTIPFLVCEIPAFLWLGFWLLRWKRSQPAQPKISLTKWDIALRVVAGVMAAWALAETALHLAPPRMTVNETTVAIARRKSVPPKWRDDFDTLARQPIWEGQKLGTLLTHAELSHYCVYELINWKLPPDIYRDFVLSPLLPGSEAELNWRRPLWEFYYPRIRKENTTEAAATIVARTLRERVTIWPGHDKPQGVETIWRAPITGEHGFELVYTATLRAVGVPARLNSDHKAEFWDGSQWRLAPRPLIESLLEPKP
jgi:dienelactone hydrolase